MQAELYTFKVSKNRGFSNFENFVEALECILGQNLKGNSFYKMT